ncbi:hypothetical protein LCGC14_0721470 [marine sediment metagenome]|uniref:Uncharacterized protein n=1 Tax=marine sediment metagenome TaxID=412755 RepID=A0A0F9QGF5_9ZZZZ
MGFDITKFDQAKIVDRTVEIPVPELAVFFAEDEKPIWKVRQLGALELAIANEAKNVNKNLQELIDKLLSSVPEDKVEALLESLGLTQRKPDTPAPEDYVYRVACLYQGSVEPEIDQVQAVRLALMNGNVFYKLSNKIIQLSGQGAQLGE